MTSTQYKSKVDIVYDALLHDLTIGKFKPGEKLIISSISKENDVSDIPVREALRRLETDGWIKISANKGAIVNDISPEHFQEVFEIKAVLEGYATRLAVDVLTPSDYSDLEAINNDLRKAASEGDSTTIGELNKEFHLRIYRDIKEQELVGMIKNLWAKYKMTLLVFSLVPERAEASVEEHVEILNLMKLKKYDEVEAAVRNHKMRSGGKIIEQLKKSLITSSKKCS